MLRHDLKVGEVTFFYLYMLVIFHMVPVLRADVTLGFI